MELHASVMSVQFSATILVSGLSVFPTLRADLYALGVNHTGVVMHCCNCIHCTSELGSEFLIRLLSPSYIVKELLNTTVTVSMYHRVPKFWTHGSVCCACTQRTGAAACVSLRLARLPRTASSAQRSRRLRSTRAAAPVLLAHANVTENINIFSMGPNLGTPHGIRAMAILCTVFHRSFGLAY